MAVAFTYTDPATSARDAVRIRVGDTVSTNEQLSDAEISYFLTMEGLTSTTTPSTSNDDAIDAAAARAADAIASKFAAKISSKSVIGISRTLIDNVRSYRELAERLRSRHNYRANIKVGGVDKSDMDDLDTDTTVIQPSFTIGGDDYPLGSALDDGWDDQCR